MEKHGWIDASACMRVRKEEPTFHTSVIKLDLIYKQKQNESIKAQKIPWGH